MLNIGAAATTETVSGVLEILGSIAKFVLGLVAEVVTVVMENPLLLIPIGVVMLYTVIRVFRSLF